MVVQDFGALLFYYLFSKNAYDDTFYTSNISPQRREFNNGVWNRLEQKIRYWSNKYEVVYVVTGGILSPNLKTIGTEKVAVPEFFYKVLLTKVKGEYKMIAFIVPNQKSDKPLYEFVVATDEVEKQTGIDFFPQLDDKVENALEKNNNYKSWSF
jgi:endonuclease G